MNSEPKHNKSSVSSFSFSERNKLQSHDDTHTNKQQTNKHLSGFHQEFFCFMLKIKLKPLMENICKQIFTDIISVNNL